MGETPLHHLLEKIHIYTDSDTYGSKLCFMDVLERKLAVDGIQTDRQDKHGQTPLHIAASKAHPRSVDLLLDNNADVNKVDTLNRRPIELAIQCAYKEKFSTSMSDHAQKR